MTPEGKELHASIRGFFEDLDDIGERVREKRHPHFRIAADEVLIENYAEAVLTRFRRSCPEARLTLIAGKGVDAVRDLIAGDIDLAISTLEGKPVRGLVREPLAARKLVLVVNKKSRVRSAAQFWTGSKITEPLIAPLWDDGVSDVFQKGLKRGGLTWAPQIVASSAGAVAPCVAGGAGVGLSIQVPYLTKNPKVRALALAGFDPVKFSAYWKPEHTTKLKPLITAIRNCVED